MNSEKLKELKQRYWADPVWSKVISAVIIAVGTGLLGLIWAGFKSIYENVSFKAVLLELWGFASDSSPLNNSVIFIAIIIMIYSAGKYLLKLRSTRKVKFKLEVDEQELPKIREHSTVFFQYRLADAFPGQRGLAWYDNPKEIVSRLSILLGDPLQFDRKDVPLDYVCDPVWWFRGTSAMFISKFRKLTSTKILMDFDEMNIERIAVNIDPLYYKCFVYVEVRAEKSTGIKKIDAEYIDHLRSFLGYAREEVGYYKGRYFAREEYEDRATIVKGKVIPIPDMKLRVRYLTKYNFLIAAKQSPYNSPKFEKESGEIFDNILNGAGSLDDFIATLDSYRKKQSFYEV